MTGLRSSLRQRIGGASSPSDEIRPEHAQRRQQIQRAGLAAIVMRISTVASTIITYSIAARVFDQPGLGIWLTLTSLFLIVGVADLGLGSSITAAIAQAGGPAATPESQRRIVSSAYPASFAVAIVIAVVGIAVAVATPSAENLTKTTGTTGAFLAVVLALAVSIPLSVGGRALDGLQRSWEVNLAHGAGMAMSLVAFIIVAAVEPLLWLMVLTAIAGRLIGSLIALASSFRSPMLRPRIDEIDRPTISGLRSAAGPFFVVSLASAAGFGIDSLILASVRGPTEVTEYASIYRLFTFVPTMTFILLRSTWPAIAEAIANDDAPWVAKLHTTSVRWTLLLNVLAAATLVAVARPLLDLWLDGTVQTGWFMIVVAAGFAVLQAVAVPLTMLSMGLDDLKGQARIVSGSALLNVGLSIPLASQLGAVGPLLASAIALCATLTLIGRRNGRILKRLSR